MKLNRFFEDIQRIIVLIIYVVFCLHLAPNYHPEYFESYLHIKMYAFLIVFCIILSGGRFKERRFNTLNKDLIDTKNRLFLYEDYENKRAEAASGNLRSQMIVAEMLLLDSKKSSDEVRKLDLAQALQWHRKAAMQGDARAQYYLGKHYFEGMCVKKNIHLAYKWFVIAEESVGSYLDDTNELAREKLAVIEKELTPEQQSDLIRAATEWREAFEWRQAEK